MRSAIVGLLAAVAWMAPAAVRAQAPDDALAAAWLVLCPGATPGSDLATRCAEISAGGPGSRDGAAAGNFLGEIPGQGRAATRDGSPDEAELRSELGAGWSVFLSADAGRLKRRDGTNEAPFDGDTGALGAGVDWAPRADWRLGLLLSHSREDLDFLASQGRSEARYTGALAIAAWNASDRLALDAYAGRLDGDYELRRAIDYTLLSGVSVNAVARAAPESERTLAGLGLTWSLPRGAWEWQFGAGLDWQRTKIDAYAESGGAGLALFVPGRAITSRRGRVDATLARTYSTGWGVWQPLLRLGWRHEFANPARPLTVRFLGDPAATPVVFETDDADANWGEAGLGAVFVFTGGHSAFVEYRQRFGHDFLQERILAIGWRFELP
ncbi:autotransporter outer membrane beta-barrel domain-containing protein [Arenimonas terrae]|uniref:Autotransporter outer membrane beta-barrel domain-containing protein n=1 Tax=Arenimonas terrae TaxID=2546226 RepID=A0A5C4RS91_9GAMM|nr:autotransporter outer membrane beta-barrel domain-containing protein [Arenimonas terrae]TNJ33437.1 autotransporter outer membrane beta-barrel domain-containing protein [Arenimonas terrae]